MKNIKLLIAVFLSVFLLTGCGEDVGMDRLNKVFTKSLDPDPNLIVRAGIMDGLDMIESGKTLDDVRAALREVEDTHMAHYFYLQKIVFGVRTLTARKSRSFDDPDEKQYTEGMKQKVLGGGAMEGFYLYKLPKTQAAGGGDLVYSYREGNKDYY